MLGRRFTWVHGFWITILISIVATTVIVCTMILSE